MRCVSCDKNLSEFETTRKIVREDGTTSYPDLCNRCYRESGLSSVATIVERQDLIHQEDIEEEEYEFVEEEE